MPTRSVCARRTPFKPTTQRTTLPGGLEEIRISPGDLPNDQFRTIGWYGLGGVCGVEQLLQFQGGGGTSNFGSLM